MEQHGPHLPLHTDTVIAAAVAGMLPDVTVAPAIAYGSSGDFVTLTVLLCIVVGAILVWLGWRGRQWWLVTWNAGLIVASIAYFIYEWGWSTT